VPGPKTSLSRTRIALLIEGELRHLPRERDEQSEYGPPKSGIRRARSCASCLGYCGSELVSPLQVF